MKRIIQLLIPAILLTAGCMRRPQVPSTSQPMPSKEKLSLRGKKEILLKCAWENGDKEEKTWCVLTPPGVILQPAIVNYATAQKSDVPDLTNEILKQIVITPEGYLRFHYLQSVRINPLVSSALLSTGTSLPSPGSRNIYNLTSLTLRLIIADSLPDPGKKNSPEGESSGELPGIPPDNAFSTLLPFLVENPDSAMEYAFPSPPLNPLPTPAGHNTDLKHVPALGQSGIPTLELYIKQPGVYKIDRQLIVKGGINPGDVQPQSFHLFCAGREIPLATWGCFANEFTENDTLLFYGYPAETPHTDRNVYQLYYDPDRTPMRMETMGQESPENQSPQQEFPEKVEPQTFLHTQKIESDEELKIHSGNFLSIKGMRWIWQEITPSKPFQLDFSLPGFVRILGKGRIIFRFYCHPGEWTTGAKIEIKINDREPEIFHIQKLSEEEKSFEIEYSQLKEKDNAMTLRMIPDTPTEGKENNEPKGIYFDYLTVEYPRQYLFHLGVLAFDTKAPESGVMRTYRLEGVPTRPVVGIEHSNSYQPRFIQTRKTVPGRMEFTVTEKGASQYLFSVMDLVPSPLDVRKAKDERLSQRGNGADYLIISYPDFIEAISPLAAHREKLGLKTRIVDVEAIYDEFNHGILSPLAIKEFLGTTLEEWQPRPKYVLLVGDSTSDYKNESRNNVKNYVPSYSQSTPSDTQDKWASDHWYTTLLGQDEYPDILLGRISVSNQEDAGNIVNKILHYENNPNFGPWRTTIGYIADEGQFNDIAEYLRLKNTPLPYSGKTVYMNELPLEDNFYLDKAFVEKTMAKVSTVATAQILDMFQQGAICLSFFGHGSPNIWADERIWFGGDSPNSDNLHLTNLERLAFVTNMTCNSGAIDYPVPKWNICITEDCMRQPKGGAIALFVPSGPGFSSSHKKISAALHKVLYKHHVHKLGDAITLTRALYLLKKESLEIIQMFILLGDPALTLQLPAEDFSLHVDKPLLSSSALPAQIHISGQAATVTKGSGIYQLFSPSNKPVQITDPQNIDGEISYSFDIPSGAERGIWVVRVYLVNEKERRDAAGAVSFIVGDPYLVIKNPRVEKLPNRIRVQDTVPLSVDVQNDSIVPSPETTVEILNIKKSSPISPDGDKGNQDAETPLDFVPEKLSHSLLPLETRTFSWEIKARAGLNIYKFLIPAYKNPDPEKPKRDFEFLAYVAYGDDSTSGDLAISSYLMTQTYLMAGNQLYMKLLISVYNLGESPVDFCQTTLRRGDNPEGPIIQTNRANSLIPGTPRPVAFTIAIDDPNSTQTYNMTVNLQGRGWKDDPTPEDNMIRIKHDPALLCDLMVDVDSIKLSEEKPTEGKTIFFDVPVTNLGSAPAQNTQIAVYDNNPLEGGKPLFNYVTRSEYTLPHLEPGCTKMVRLRWDPVKNAGENNLYIMADPKNQAPETNKKNNLAIVSVYVRTKALLKSLGIEIRQTPEEREKLTTHLVARVQNSGETDARNVYIRYFKSKIQTPETMIGESFIKQIAAGEIVEDDYTWKLTEQETRFTYSPSFQIFLKGSSQRISSEEQGESGENKPGPGHNP